MFVKFVDLFLREILEFVSQKWISQNSTKWRDFGSAGGRIPKEGEPPFPKSAGEGDPSKILKCKGSHCKTKLKINYQYLIFKFPLYR